MLKIFLFVLAATVFEAAGDAVIRKAIYDHAGPARILYFVVGTLLLAAYGTSLNLAPVEFGRVVGIYIATLFVVFQITNFIAFRAPPTLPVIVGGLLVVSGGLISALWRATTP